ncbi:MAG TPA: amino acid permease [Candidatus Acidoferrum sp.]|nr:amino acid permease [Candidatus Acidoferrum sp.]
MSAQATGLAQSSVGLVRTIGRWSLAALMLNTMIGASIFGLPSIIAGYLGKLSPVGYLIAFAGVAVIAACLAEVSSYFQQAGGPYLYTRVAFGRFAAIQIGWLTWLSRITACSGVANLFITYLSSFFPAVTRGWIRGTILTVLIGFLAAVNYRGVSGGTALSNFFTITKVLLLTLFIAGGFMALALHPSVRVTPASVPLTAANCFQAILLMVYAYGGFEAALFASGEASDPRKDAPVALMIAMVTATSLYICVQVVVIYTLANPGATTKPAVDSASHFLGPVGVTLVAVGTLISVYGYLSANMLHTPRVTFAMGESGDFPSFFAAIHPRFRTPHLSIVVFALMLILFSIGGNFRWNASLSAISRLFMYGAIVAALPVLRSKYPKGSTFRLPAGLFFSALGLAFVVVLLAQMHRTELIVMSITFTVAALNWLWARGRALGIVHES